MEHKISNSTERLGIIYMNRIISKSGKIFREIKRENDKGIDIIIEQTNKKGEGIGKFVAFQVKSGESFFKSSTQLCTIKIENHRDYWGQHPMPVYGAVYIPSLKKAYIVNIKDRLHETTSNTISFYVTDSDVFDFNIETLNSIINNEIIKRPYNEVFLDFIDDENLKPIYTLIKRFSKSIDSIIDRLLQANNFIEFISAIGVKLNDKEYLKSLNKLGHKNAIAGFKYGTFTYCEDYLGLKNTELEYYKNTFHNAQKYLLKNGK
ncbi:DUF4365 domain-containing protein [Halosquirtibacter laminarini]|uniref:DUF4365 domain-containing protein n=1 Tax=Halosquirtibacter laminarini TaxID=3374600 RepID=A0AC61NIK3_9BACT|nr:DUF4365 domain-containing protein [Prolixibacteraceae bacterium]